MGLVGADLVTARALAPGAVLPGGGPADLVALADSSPRWISIPLYVLLVSFVAVRLWRRRDRGRRRRR